MTNNLLEVSRLTMHFGGLIAVNNISFEVKSHEVFAIIGPNGAGKTTVFNCICGFYQPTSGLIQVQDKDITNQSTHKIAQYGLVRTFQNIRLFKKLTVIENLLVAQNTKLGFNLLPGLFNSRSYRESEKKSLIHVEKWLDFFNLRKFANIEAGYLSYGYQKWLEIARCMITKPKLLMLDEPAAGLNPQEKKSLKTMIHKLCSDYKISVLLIEHDMNLIMGISNRILVMENGKKIIIGTPHEVQNNDLVIKAYLGEE